MSPLRLWVVVGWLVSVSVLGCGQSSKPGSQGASGSAPSVSGSSDAGASADAKIAAALAQLSPEDRALAEQQKTCPVSQEPLGSMGVPVKVDVAGRTVFLCCEGCRADLLSDPDKYLPPAQGTAPTESKPAEAPPSAEPDTPRN